MNCGICEGGFSVNVYTKSLCILVNRKVQNKTPQFQKKDVVRKAVHNKTKRKTKNEMAG